MRSLRRGCMPSWMRSRPTISKLSPQQLDRFTEILPAVGFYSSGTWYAGFAGVQFALCALWWSSGLRRSHRVRYGPEGQVYACFFARRWLGSGHVLAWLFWFDALLALCALWSSPGLRCFASWPVWTRRTVTRRDVSLIVVSCTGKCKTGTAGWDTPFPSVVAGPDARHHGGYGSEGQLRGWLVILVTIRCILFSCRLV